MSDHDTITAAFPTVSRTPSHWQRFRQGIQLLLCFLFAFSLAACSTWPDLPIPHYTTAANPVSGERLSATALVQKLATAVNGDTDLAAVFASIPDKQRDHLTLDEFQQYIELLQRGISGKITTFSRLNESALAVIRQTVETRLPQQVALSQASLGYWLQYESTGSTDGSLSIFIQQDESGQVYLSADWIRQILSQKNFATLYFDAIDRQNQPALAVLLAPTATSPLEAEFLAGRLIEFYQNQTNTTTADFKLTQARSDGLAFTEYSVVDLDMTPISSRTIELQAQPDGSVKVLDQIPDRLEPADAQIRQADVTFIDMGAAPGSALEMVYGPRIEKITGQPFQHGDINCLLQADGSRIINLHYQELFLTVQGTCPDHVRWNGRIKSAILYGDRYHLASGLAVGSPLRDLLTRYPFIIQNQYQVTGNLPGGKVRLTVSVENEQVSRIQLDWLE